MNDYQLLSPPRNINGHDRVVRQAFLRSYTFQVRESYRERAIRSFRELSLKRSLRKLNEMGKMLVVQISCRMFDGRIRGRALGSFRLKLPRFSQFDPLKCFVLRKGDYSDELAI